MTDAIGIDIGGTKVACALVNDSGNIIKEVHVPSNPETAESMYESVTQALNQLLEEIQIPANTLAFGVGVPGLVNVDEGLAVFQNNLPWRDFPIVQKLKEDYQPINVVVDNDVYQAAFAEWKHAGLGEKASQIFLTASTGVSCATIIGGTFLRGGGFAGEVGLLPMERNGVLTTLESEIGGNNFAKKASEKLGREVTTKDLFEGYQDHKEEETKLVEEWIYSFAQGLYSLIAIVDPNRIVLGGSIVKLNPWLLPLIKEQVQTMMLPVQYNRLEQIHLSYFDNNAGVIGAGLRGLE